MYVVYYFSFFKFEKEKITLLRLIVFVIFYSLNFGFDIGGNLMEPKCR
jgi:hypothetical protein